MKLPERLETIISMVPKCGTVADIGCDHAYVSIALVERGIAEHAIACDINAGPLKHAEENIRAAGFAKERLGSEAKSDKDNTGMRSGWVETRLCDGLSGVKSGEADTVIIAGMGGMLMEKILEGRLQDFSNYVFSPQLDIPHFRYFLIDHGCSIEDEQMLQEDGKFYVVMRVEHRPEASMYQREIDFLFGGWLLARKDSVLKSFLEKEQIRYQNILMKTEQADIKDKLHFVEEALSSMK